RHAGCGLVHQEEPGPVRERNRELHSLQVAVGELSTRLARLVLHPDPLEKGAGFPWRKLPERGKRGSEASLVGAERHLHVLACSHGAEGGGDLERAADPKPPDIARRPASQGLSIELY